MVAITLIVVLAMIGMGGIKAVQQRGKAVQCVRNLQEVTRAIFNYANEQRGFLPWYEVDSAPPAGPSSGFWWYKVGQHAGMGAQAFGKTFTCPGVKDQRPFTYAGVEWSYTYSYNKRFGYRSDASWVYPRRNLRFAAYPQRVPMLADDLARVSDNAAGFESTTVESRTWKVHGSFGNVAFLDGHIEAIPQTAGGDLRQKYDFIITP